MKIKNVLKIILEKLGVLNLIYSFKEIQDSSESLEMQRKRQLFYRDFVSDDDLVFDIGANVGNRTSIFIKLGAKVIAVEPQLKQAKLLEKKFTNKAIIINKGLGKAKGVEFMYLSNRSTLSTFSKDFISKVENTRFSSYKWNDRAITQITTLSSLINEYGLPKFCKIDVEGYEFFVLEGLDIAIPCLSIEYNVPEFSDTLGKCIKKLNILSSSYLFNYSVGETSLFAMDVWLSYEEFINIIETPTFLQTRFGDVYAKICKIDNK
jgi:FkbM family methyltransferase